MAPFGSSISDVDPLTAFPALRARETIPHSDEPQRQRRREKKMTTDPITLDPDALTAVAKALGKYRGVLVGEIGCNVL